MEILYDILVPIAVSALTAIITGKITERQKTRRLGREIDKFFKKAEDNLKKE
jgi:hypothetical protein